MKTREVLPSKTTLASTCIAVFLLAFQSPAQEKTWTGAVDGSWVTAGNWSPSGLVTDVDSVLYNSSSVANLTQTLDQNWSVTNLQVTSVAAPITITPGSGSFVLTNTGGIDMSAATADLTVLADYHPINNGTLNVAAGRTLTLSNILAAINNATTGGTAGAGTVRIIGTGGRLSDNFGAGTLIIDGGHLAGNPPVRLGASSGSTVTAIVTNNGSLDISSGNSTRIRLGQVASDGTSTNRLILDGGSITIIGSTSTGANGIFVGDEAGTVGILDINNGAIDMTDDRGQDSVLRIGNVAGSIGTVNLNANGRLQTRRIDRISGYAIFNWNGGILETLAGDPEYFKAVDQVNLLSLGAVVDTGPRTVGFMGSLSGVGGLTKLGSGSLNLAGANTYVGSTVISNGSFSASLPMSSGSLFLGTNVSLALTVGSTAGDTWSLSTMTLQASNTLTFTYGPASQPSSTLVTTVALNASGTNLVTILGSGWPVGTTRLIDYSGTINGGGTFVFGALPIGVNARLTNNTSTTSLDLVVSSGVNNLTWSGNTGVNPVTLAGYWDLATSINWLNGAAPSVYNEYGPATNRLGDSVYFNENGNLTVEVTETVRPSSVTVTNSSATSPYTFQGTGKISGPTSLTKIAAEGGVGAGSYMLLKTVNDYTGGTYIKGGGVMLGVENALPTSGVIFLGSAGPGANLSLNGFNQTIAGIVSTGSGSGQRRVLNVSDIPALLTINVPAGQMYSYTHQMGNTTTGGTALENNFSVLKTGPGVQAFGNCGYSGTTVIANGTLLFNGAAAIKMTNSVTVQSGATIGGNSTNNNCLGGPVTVQSGGRMEPGNLGIGGLQVSNTVTLTGITVMELNRTNAFNCDRLVADNLVLGGTLIVTNIGDALQGGDTFNLFDHVLSGNFSAVTLPALSSGLVWNTNALTTTGIISVNALPVPSLNAPTISGGNLILSGSGGAANATYYVLTSVNVATPVGLWTPVATNQLDGSGAFTIPIPVNSGEPQRFYLLQLP